VGLERHLHRSQWRRLERYELVTAPDVRDSRAAQFLEPIPGTQADFRARIAADLAR
jgi:hypothetical protein